MMSFLASSNYATLNGMDISIITVASWLFMLSVYAIIYKAVSSCFRGVSNFKAGRQREKEKAAQKERFMKDIQALSKREIAILKFVLAQEANSAWLPDNYKPVMLLIEKSYLVQIGIKSKSISSLQLSFDYSLVHLFTVPENIQKLIADMPPEFIKKWRKVKPDRSFEDCQ